MRKFLLIGASMLLFGVAYATSPVLTINGEVADKTPTKLTFDGDNVVIHFGDITENYDMGSVSLTFPTTGIADLQIMQITKIVGDNLEVCGVTDGSTLNIYDLNGRNCVSAVAAGGKANINVSVLVPGVYMLQTGNKCVKFVKR